VLQRPGLGVEDREVHARVADVDAHHGGVLLRPSTRRDRGSDA
jgi:hypothetical protein